MGFFENAFNTVKKASKNNVQKSNVNISKPKTTRDVLNQINLLRETDKEQADYYANELFACMQNSSSWYYNPYTQATNKAVNNLQELGFDVSNINDDWYNKNSWLKNYYVTTANTNGLSSTMTNKRASNEQKAAYNYDQLWKAEETTKKAEAEWEKLQKELTYWANRTDRNYSDEEIIGKINWNNYKTLQKMDSTRLEGTPLELNRAIGYSEDAMYGVLWAARNGGSTGNLWLDMANSANGTGYKYNSEIANKLNPESTEFDGGYSLGSTNVDEAALYFGVTGFTKDWVKSHESLAFSNDETEKKMYSQVRNAYENQLNAEEEYKNLIDFINTKLKYISDPEKIMSRIDWKKYPTLAAMDKSIGQNGNLSTGDLVALTEGLAYRYDDLKKQVEDVCAKKKGVVVDYAASIISQVAGIAAPEPTEEQKKVISETDKKLAEDAEMMYEIATPAEKAVTENAGSVTYPEVKNAWTQIYAKGLDTMDALTQNTVKSSIGNLSSSILQGADVVQNYNAYKSELESKEKLRDDIKAELGDLVYYGKEIEEAPVVQVEINGKLYDLKLNWNWKATMGEYNEETGERDYTGSYQDAGLFVHGTNQTEAAQGDFTREQYEEAVRKAIWDKNQERQSIENVRDAQLAEGQQEKIYEYTDAVNYIENAQEYMRQNEEAYNTAVERTEASNAMYNMTISMLKTAGIDTTEMEKAQQVSDFLLNFAQYSPTEWKSYSTYDVCATALSNNSASKEEVFATAKEMDAEMQKNIELAKWLFDYAEENGIQMPDSIKENVLRWEEKLEREHEDFDYMAYMNQPDFDAGAAKGREMAANIPEFDWAAFGTSGKLDTQPGWDLLSDDQKKKLESDAEIYSPDDLANEYNGFMEGMDLESRLFGTYRMGELMTDYEKDTFYYLLATQGLQGANEYYDHLTDGSYGVMNSRAADVTRGNANELAGSGFWGRRGADVLSMLLSPVAAIGSLYYMAETGLAKLRGERVEVNPNNINLSANIYKKEARQKIQEDILKTYGKQKVDANGKPVLDANGNPVYEKTMLSNLMSGLQEIISNRGDSFVNMVAFGPLFKSLGISSEFVTASPMAIAAATDAVADAKEKGASDTQLLGIFAATFLAEAGTETIEIGDMMKAFQGGVSGSAMKEFLKKWLTQSGISEAFGESLNDLIENYADEAFMGDKSEFAQAVRRYEEEDHMDRSHAEAAARRDQMMGVLHTALISYLSPGLDIVSYGGGRFLYYRDQARKAQENNKNYDIFDIMNRDKERRELAGKIDKAAKTYAEIEEIERNNSEKPNGEAATASEGEAGVAMPDKNAQQLTLDYEALESAKSADASSQTATISKIIDTQGTDVSGDIADAAATNIWNLFKENPAEAIQELIVGAHAAGIDANVAKRAIQVAALSGDSNAFKVVQSEEFRNANPADKALMLSRTTYSDSNNFNVMKQIRKSVFENRVAFAEKEAVNDPAVQQKQKAAYDAQGRLLEAQDATTEAQKDYDALASELEAKQENLRNADPADNNAIDHAIAALTKTSEVVQEYKQRLENTQKAEQKAQEEVDKAVADYATTKRQVAEQIALGQDQQRAEAAALAEAQAAEQAAQAEQQQLVEEENNNANVADEEGYLAMLEEKNGPLTEEEKQRARESFERVRQQRAAQQAKQEGDEFGKFNDPSAEKRRKAKAEVERRFGLKIVTLDTLKEKGFFFEGKFAPEENTIYLDSEKITNNDIMYKVLGHELTHIAELAGQDTYNALANSIARVFYGNDVNVQQAIENLKKNNGIPTNQLEAGIVKRKADYDKHYGNVSYEYAAQEHIADRMGDIINQKDDAKRQDMVNRLVADDPSTAKRLLNAIKSFLKKAVGMKGAWQTNAQKTVDMLERAISKAQKNPQEQGGENRYSLGILQKVSDKIRQLIQNKANQSQFAKEYNAWNKKDTGVQFFIGKPSDTLKKLGVPDIDIMFSGDKINEIKAKHPAMNDDNIIKQIPNIVNNPILVMQSKTHSDRITMFGELVDKKGFPVLAALSMTPTADPDTKTEFLVLRSAYGKDQNPQGFIDSSKILYKDETRADAWATDLRLQLPSADASIGSSGEIVAPESSSVNTEDTGRFSLPSGAKPIVTDEQGDELATELPGGTVNVTPDARYSLSSFNSEEQDRVRQALYNAANADGTKRFTKDEVDKYMNDALGIASVIAANKARLDFEVTDPEKSMVKSNSDYGASIDASTLCAKRLVYQGTFDAIQHLLPNTPLMPSDLIHLSDMMREMGYETPCGICYVESRRRNLDSYIAEWLENYNGEYVPRIDEVSTTDGLEEIRKNHPQVYKDFMDAMNSHGKQNNPKPVQLRTEYKGEIRKLSDRSREKFINHGGIRLQSFSDFETPHLLDMVQVVMDIASKNLTSQAYTKVPNFAWAFGDTGIKINLSLIGKGEGVDENGNLIFDDVEGMPFEEAMKLRDRYSKNVGTILVGINDKQILAAMADPRIDYIIPFHSSGWTKEDMRLMPTLEKYKDYQNYQTEKDMATGAKTTKNKGNNIAPVGAKDSYGNGYWDFKKTGKQNAEKYLDLCYKNKLIPVFSQFLDKDEKGHYHLKKDGSTDGYWKLLIDFKMYDNEGKGSPQLPVTPNINMVEANRILSEYNLTREQPGSRDERNTPPAIMKDNNSLPVAQPVVERFVEEYKANHPLYENRTRYSLPTQEVEETAEKAFPNTKARTPDGKLMPVYHGTNADFNVFDTSISGGKNGTQEGYGIYLTDNEEIPKQYGGRTISAYVNMERPAYDDKKTFKRTELAKVIKAACEKEAQQFVDEGSYDNVKEAVRDTWISNYVYTPEYRTIDEAYKAVAGMIIDQNDSDSEIISELLIGQGIRDYSRAMDFYHNILTPLTGFDGIWAHWTNRNTGENSNVLLAFDSSQIKSNEPVTYDDQGNPIPMDQRFDTSNPDIRYSLPSDAPYLSAVDHGDMEEAAEYVKEYSESKGYTDDAYHGTNSFGFTEFDMPESQNMIFVAYNPTTASTYARQNGVRDIGKPVDDLYNMWNEKLAEKMNELPDLRYDGGSVIRTEVISQEEMQSVLHGILDQAIGLLDGKEFNDISGRFGEGVDIKKTFAKTAANRFGDSVEEWNKCNTPKEMAEKFIEMFIGSSNMEVETGGFNFLDNLCQYFANPDKDLFNKLTLLNHYNDLAYDEYNSDGLFRIETLYGGETSYAYETRANILNYLDRQLGYGIYRFYTRPGKQLVVDANYANWSRIPWASVEEADPNATGYYPPDNNTMTRQIARWAKENGYDSVRINNVYDHGGQRNVSREDALGDIGIFFNPEDVKSADTVTYDDNGNVIPLSERFNDQKKDFRYSLPSDDILDQQINEYLDNGGVLGQNTPTTPENPNMGYRQWGNEGAQRSDELAEEAKEIVFNSEYAKDTNAAELARAIQWVRSNKQFADDDGFSESLRQVTSKRFNYRTKDGQAKMVAVMALAAAKKDTAAQVQLAEAYNQQGTDLGQALQARKLFRLMTPQGRIATLQKMVLNVQNDLDSKGVNAEIKLSDWIYEAAAQASDEKVFSKIRQAAAIELGEQIPANWKDKLRGLRMLSMLGNPRTHVRNFIGNALFVPAVGLKNKMGAVAETVFNTEERTKTMALTLRKDVRDFARQDAEFMKDDLTGESKYNEGTLVQRAEKPFKGFMQALIDFNSAALEKEDWFFLKGHYRRALGGWIQANGYTIDQLKQNPELLDKGRAYAIEEAQKATYRDFNGLAAKLNQLSRDPQTTGQKVLGFATDAILPFKKTPANILKRGIEYSPAGLVRGLKNAMLDVRSGKVTATQAIDRICSGLAGSAVMAMGYFLANAGCASVDDDDEMEKLKGGQKYAINPGKALNTVFGAKLFGEDVTFTMDWAAPMSMPFFVGAALQKEFAKDGEFDINAIFDSMGNIAEPVFNLSMLDGVNTLFKTAQSGDTNAMTQIGAKVLTNYATSYVPSLLGAVARTVDDYRRATFVKSGEGKGLTGSLRYAQEQTENKIPGLSQTNIPVRDMFGNAETSSLVERILENFILPGYISNYKDDPVLNEMDRLYSANVTGSDKLIKDNPPKTVTYNKQKYVLDAEQWDTYKAERGQTAYRLLTELINSDGYQDATPEAQVQMFQNVWDYAEKVGKKAVIPDYEMEATGNPVETVITDGKVEAYSKEMIRDLETGDYVAYDTMVEALREQGVEDSTIRKKISDKYCKQYKEAYRKADYDKMGEIEEILFNTGFDFDIAKWEADEEKKILGR